MNGLQIDINTGDLLVERSAAVVADASGFIAELVLRSCRGEFKEHPLLEIGRASCRERVSSPV